MKQFDERDIWDVGDSTIGRFAYFVKDVVTSAHWGYWLALGATLCIPGCVP